MKTINSFIFLSICLLSGISSTWAVDGQPLTFIPVSQADVLVITHQQLQTPGWVPGMLGAWETELLIQKNQQGYGVALWAIQDGINQNDIKSYLETNQGSFKFVYILGDAHRPENDPPIAPIALPPSNYSDGNIIPIWRELIDTFWRDANGDIKKMIAEHDRGYIQNITGVSIGRVPVASRQEILDYLSKSATYLALGQSPVWSQSILEAVNDVSCFYNGCSGLYVQAFMDLWANEFPQGWTLTTLATSTGPSDPAQRALQFESALNNDHYGLVQVIGTSGDAIDLAEWYYGNSSFNFSNAAYLPFVLAPDCEIAAFDQYASGIEKNCVVENMLLDPNGGIIGTIGATGARALRSIMESAMTDIMFELPSHKNLQKCIITKDVIEKKSAPKLIYSQKKKTA